MMICDWAKFGAALLAFALAQPILAQDAAKQEPATPEIAFPKGSTFGIVPFAGSVEAEQFTGFADLETSASVMINEMPLDAWSELAEGFAKPETLAQAGITASSVETVTLGGMEAIRIAGTQSKQGLSIPKCIVLVKGTDKVGFLSAQIPFQDDFGGDACSMIQGVSQRTDGDGIAEKLAALPFAVSDLAGLRIVRTVGGSGLLLTKGPEDVSKSYEQPVMIIASSLSTTAGAMDPMAFSEAALSEIPLHTLGRSVDAAETTLAGFPATRIVREAKHDSSAEDVRIAHWVIFKPDGNYVRLFGIAKEGDWTASYAQFQKVAAGLSLDQTRD